MRDTSSRKDIAAVICLLALAPATAAGLATQLDLYVPDWAYSPVLGWSSMTVITVTLALTLFLPSGRNR